jgi:hypothetical protein
MMALMMRDGDVIPAVISLITLIYIVLIRLKYRKYAKFNLDVTLCVNDSFGHITQHCWMRSPNQHTPNLAPKKSAYHKTPPCLSILTYKADTQHFPLKATVHVRLLVTFTSPYKVLNASTVTRYYFCAAQYM